MSKRTRGSARAHRRPGARPPTSRPAGARPSRPAPVPERIETERPTQLERAPERAAETIEARPGSGAVERTGHAAERPMRTGHARQRAKPGSLLASRATTEYTYVAQDLRRISLVSAVLLAIMLAAWLAIAVFGLIPLDFY